MTAPSPVPPFAEKTYSIVDGESDDIVEWAMGADGEDTFVIKDATTFQDKILPRFFNHSNYSSFTRQLNNYGFTKVRSPASSPASSEAVAGTTRGGRLAAEVSWWEFKHPRFRRGRKDLLCEIKRREDKRATSSSSPAAIERKSEVISDDSLGSIHRELDHVKRDVQRIDSKLDELKSMMMQLLMHLQQRSLDPRVLGREVSTQPGTVRVFGSTLDPSPERYTPNERRGYRVHQEWSEQGHTPGEKDTTLHLGGQQQQQKHMLQLPPPQQQDTRPLAGTDSRKRSREEANTSAFHLTQRYGSMSHPVSVSEGSAQGCTGGNRDSRVEGELEEQRTNIPREEGAGDSTDDRDRGVEYGHWGRAWPRAAIADLEPSPYTRRLPLLRVPVGTSRPLTPPNRVPGVPLVGRDPLGPRTSEAGRGMDFGGGGSSGGSGGTERSRRPAHPPPWTLPPLQSKLPQARLPLPRADSYNAPTLRESPVSGSALSDPEEIEGSRPIEVTRQQDHGHVADRDPNESVEASRRRPPVDDAHHEGGQWVKGRRQPSSS